MANCSGLGGVPGDRVVKDGFYYPCFSKNQEKLWVWLNIKQATSKVVYSPDLNIYFVMAYVISSAIASMLIKYGFILLKIFHVSNTAVSWSLFWHTELCCPLQFIKCLIESLWSFIVTTWKLLSE